MSEQEEEEEEVAMAGISSTNDGCNRRYVAIYGGNLCMVLASPAGVALYHTAIVASNSYKIYAHHSTVVVPCIAQGTPPHVLLSYQC